MLERCYSFFHYCLLSYRYVMFQKHILCKLIGGAQAVVRGARPPWPPSSDGTDLNSGPSNTATQVVKALRSHNGKSLVEACFHKIQ